MMNSYFSLLEKLSLEYHEELNPKLWKENGILKSPIEDKLLLFAKVWQEYCHIPDEAIKDIVITGGNVNYNYTEFSDIDLHLVADFEIVTKELGISGTTLEEYLWDKKTLWTLTHDIKIYSYPIEPYVERSDQKITKDKGVYSIKKSKWIQKPEKKNLNFENDKELIRKIRYYQRTIDKMISSSADEESTEKFWDKIVNMRRAAIADKGEFSFENLVFKELRNSGYISKLKNYRQHSYDAKLSLEARAPAPSIEMDNKNVGYFYVNGEEAGEYRVVVYSRKRSKKSILNNFDPEDAWSPKEREYLQKIYDYLNNEIPENQSLASLEIDFLLVYKEYRNLGIASYFIETLKQKYPSSVIRVTPAYIGQDPEAKFNPKLRLEIYEKLGFKIFRLPHNEYIGFLYNK